MELHHKSQWTASLGLAAFGFRCLLKLAFFAISLETHRLRSRGSGCPRQILACAVDGVSLRLAVIAFTLPEHARIPRSLHGFKGLTESRFPGLSGAAKRPRVLSSLRSGVVALGSGLRS